MQKQLDSIMNKTMDRREFLAHVGVAVTAVIGARAIVQSLSSYRHSSPRPNPLHNVGAQHGFGGSKFGS